MDDTSRRIDPVSGDRSGAGDLDDVLGRTTDTTRGYIAGETDDVDRRTRAIRHEIEETRGEMSETIDAIQDKLKPRNIVANATERVKSATTERVREMADAAGDTAQQAMNYTRDRAGDIADNMRQNPIPLAMIGVGALWLLSNRTRGRREYSSYRRNRFYGDQWRDRPGEPRTDRTATDRTADTMTDSANQLAARTREYASDAADSVRRTARRSQNQLQRMLRDNPLLVGAGALLLGAAFGLAVPETDAENEWMGETRDSLVGRARDVARDAANQVQDAASNVADAAGRIAGNKPQS